MSANIYYCDTFLNALSNSYPAGTYVRTLGFASVGDGGAAMYKVIFDVPSGASSYTATSTTFNYADGKFYASNGIVFQLVPQNGLVYAEQFGVMPDNADYYASNTSMLNLAVSYASDHGVRLEFASKGTYYLNSNICLKSNLFVDGNGAVLVQHTDAPNDTGMFCTEKIDDVYVARKNITINNITLIGRTREHYNPGDQAFHVCIDGFTLHNVAIKNFSFGVHTYGRYTTAGDYTVPEIPNKNWLIDNCTITDTVMGLQLSEIDGITVKDSTIMGYCPTKFPKGTYGPNSNYDGYDYPEAHIFDFMGGLHNIYLSANCLNVRVSNVTMGNSTGDAIHKAFPPKADSDAKKFIRADISKNHFYTDVSINKVNSPLTIGIVSENVMCDNVFATDLRYCIYLSTADNCIVSNSYLSATRADFPRKDWDHNDNRNICIYTEDASKCWFQNTHLYYTGVHRRASDVFNEASAISRGYNRIMSENKKHRRNYIGDNFDINNYMLKFTGCDMISTYGTTNYYFEELMRSNDTDWLKNAVTEYWDNCSMEFCTGDNLFRFKCLNDLPTGLTIRNSCFHNSIGYQNEKAPFRYECAVGNCDCCEDSSICFWYSINKRFPWVRFENVLLDNAGYWLSSNLNHITSTISATNFSVKKAVDISGSYVMGSYKLVNGVLSTLSNKTD